MKILLDGYLDNNLGDDLMIELAARTLGEHELFCRTNKIKNAQFTDKTSGFDCYLKVIGSGFLIHNNKGILYRLRDMYRERKYAPIHAVVNCNVSPFINKIAERVIRHHLKSYDFITVRDSVSQEYIKSCECYPDMVFSLPDDMIPRVECENALGIAVHGSIDEGDFAKVADEYVAETGNKVLLLCFDSGLENDVLTAENVYNKMKHSDMAEVIVYTSVADMLSNMCRCSVILGVRFHSVVLSARMGIPFVPVAYSDKLRNVMEYINYTDTIYSPSTDAKSLINAVRNAHKFDLDKSVVTKAECHMEKFKEYIKRQV